jgi:hypothetical protein
MEKNDIITFILIILICIVLYKIKKTNENYDTGYNQYTTFKDEAKKFNI